MTFENRQARRRGPPCQCIYDGRCFDDGAIAYEQIDARDNSRYYFCTRHGKDAAERYEGDANIIVRRMTSAPRA